jgi:hypothetical protein
LSQIVIAEFDEAHEVGEQFVVWGCDASELFELVEEALNDVALFVEFDVVVSLDLAVSFWWNDDLSARLGDGFAKMVNIITLVRECYGRLEAVNEIMREGDVVALAGTGEEADGVAHSVSGRMDFCAQSAARLAQTLGVHPPFSLRAQAPRA